MKKSCILALTIAASLAASAATKIGVVDMLLLVKNHPAYESNKTLLTNTEKDLRKKLDEMKKELDSIQEEAKKHTDTLSNPMVAAKAKADAEKALADIQGRFMRQQQKMRAEMMRDQQELSSLEARLLKTQADDLKKRVAAFATKHGYDLVVDMSAAMFSKESLDVTDAVLKDMGVDPKTARSKE